LLPHPQKNLNRDFPLKAVFLVDYLLAEKSPGKLTLGSCKNRRKDNIKNVFYEIRTGLAEDCVGR
jgi:hypothetical protein